MVLALFVLVAMSQPNTGVESCEADFSSHREKVEGCRAGQRDNPRDFPNVLRETCRFEEKTKPVRNYDSYYHSLNDGIWTTPDHLASWIGKRFAYNNSRANSFSSDKKGGRHPYSPDHLFMFPGTEANGMPKEQLGPKEGGVCLDLAHFARHTLQKIEGVSGVKYVRLEYEPCSVKAPPGKKGPVLRRHWITSYLYNGKIYFIGDSRFPGGIYGPFDSTAEFMKTCYSDMKIGNRELLCYELRDDYKIGKNPDYNQPPIPGHQEGAGEQ